MKLIEIETTEAPEMIIMCGPPGVGKSTWLRQYLAQNSDKNYVIISSDDEIDQMCASAGLTYAQGFEKFIGQATAMIKDKLQSALHNNQNIIIDQTNLSAKTRRAKISQAPNYKKIAVVFNLTDTERERRYTKRAGETGKTIPRNVIDTMLRSFKMPEKSEGFEKVIVVRQ